MLTADITRRIEFDSGHRIPHHSSKCKNVHGHRYVLEATVRGPVYPVRGQTDDGMVLDFGDLKGIMQLAVGEKWDHGFLLYDGDEELTSFFSELRGHKTVVLPFVPTVENLAQHAFFLLRNVIDRSRYRLHHVRLWETPNCWADIWADQQTT